jgi:glycosyltransferase involved in cell wall biosynthesis
MSKPLLSIVIPTHNSKKTIYDLLSSISISNFRHFKEIEVLIIDDCSKDQTVTIVKNIIPYLKFKLVLKHLNKNVGPARARNQGVKKAVGKYILFLDSDVILAKNTLNCAFQFAKIGKIRAFTGIWHYRQYTKKFFPQFKALRDWAYWFIEREKNARYYLFSTRIAGIEKKLFNQIGGFNINYPEPTIEDIELTYRIEKIKKIKFSSKLLVYHEFEDFWPIAVKYFKRSRDWIQLYQKRLRFDPVATSKKEAVKSITAGLFIAFALSTLLFRTLIYPSILFFLIFSLLELKFWMFLLKKKGLIFLLKSIPVSILLYLIINLGSAWGILKDRLK